MLNNAVNRERLMGYAEDVLLPATAKDITLMETVEEEGVLGENGKKLFFLLLLL